MPVNKDFYTLAGSSGQSTGYEIDQSIRFNDDNSAYMSKTYGSASNRKTWTFSCWLKRGNLQASGFHTLFGRTSASYYAGIHMYNDDFQYTAASGGVEIDLVTDRKFRDPSAWYHLVVAQDTTQNISNERVRMYVNGQRETSFSTETYPSKDYQGWINQNAAHEIGRSQPSGSPGRYLDGYLAEIYFLDGYAYGPEYFGEFDDYGIWRPIEYDGSYGTNGFKIDGRDSSDLGDDESGQGNDYSTSGLVATDKRTDSPTNNHATFNPLVNASATYANGNVQTSISSAYAKAFMSFTLPNTGTWYWEGQEFNNVVNPASAQGIVDADVEQLDDTSVSNRLSTPMSTFTGIVVYSNTGQSLATYEFKNGVNTSTSGAVIISTSRLGYLWEPENNRLTIYDDGSQYQQFTSINSGNYIFGVNMATGGAPLSYRLFVEANDWTQTPAGITSANALNTKNIGS